MLEKKDETKKKKEGKSRNVEDQQSLLHTRNHFYCRAWTMSNNLTKDRSLKRFSNNEKTIKKKKKKQCAPIERAIDQIHRSNTLVRYHWRPIIPKNALPKGAFLSGSEVEDIPKNSPRPINLITRNSYFPKNFPKSSTRSHLDLDRIHPT